MKYAVHMTQTVSTAVEVEAASVGSAFEKANYSDDMPGSITHGAFGQASVDEAGEWTPVSVYDVNNYDKPLWEDPTR